MGMLATLLSSRVRAQIFGLLFGLAGSELHLREIERRSRLTVGTVRQDLRKLVALGLVTARRAGNRTYYAANPNHPLFPEIRGLVLKTSGLVEVLAARLGTNGVRTAFVFGSVAAGTEGTTSDVDLLVVGTVTLRELSARLAGVADTIGREINPFVLTPQEFTHRVRDQEHFVSRVLGSPKLFVVGSEHDLAAMG